MIQSKKESRQSLLERIKAQLDPEIPAAERARLNVFVQHYYQQVPLADLVSVDVADLGGAMLCHWQNAKDRSAGEDSVRVYNPDLATDGWQCAHTVVEIVTDDRPFLVDSVNMALDRQQCTVHLTTHPIIQVSRDSQGRMLELSDDGQAESLIQIQIDRQGDRAHLDEIEQEVRQVLDDVRRATDDWQAMLARVNSSLPLVTAEDPEAGNLLRWLHDHHFTFLAACDYRCEGQRLSPLADTALGLLRDADHSRLMRAAPTANAAFAAQSAALTINKSLLNSTIHHPGYLDLIAISLRDDNGQVCGQRILLGLFTASVYQSSVADIPWLSKRLEQAIADAGLSRNSHNGKALANILESFPRDSLFQLSTEQITETSTGILGLQERQKVRVFSQNDPYSQFQNCIVFIPRERYGRELRLKIEETLRHACKAAKVEFDTLFSSASRLARIFYVVELTEGTPPNIDWQEIEAQIADYARGWDERLRQQLLEHFGEAQGTTLSNRYAQAFSGAYRETFSPRAAGLDIEHLESVRQGAPLSMSLSRPPLVDANRLRLKMFVRGDNVPLSDVLPLLENMGLFVSSENPYSIKLDDTALWLHQFDMCAHKDIDLKTVAPLFEEAFQHVWARDVENDGFNSLILNAGLGWRDTVLLRAYSRYMQQIRFPFSQRYIIDCLNAHTTSAKILVDLFNTRFNPAFEGDRGEAEQALQAQLNDELDKISSLDHDRILRAYQNLIGATLRSNYYQLKDGATKSYISFKLNPKDIDGIPLPRPMYEIFVYSPRFEAVHLRGGSVARGGLRWSDRMVDFRTEVLGLVKAQMVKNAVIVPVGSKGGFVVKRPPADGGREAQLAEGISCYQNFLRGLLDITDNLVGGDVVPPVDVVRHDGDDPYLVVAADKGTATFSDFANAVSEEYGFWLGDAFASGGSVGYDHKGMGITAKGAWESVKRHFREMGHNTQTTDFSVVGVGDMAGDVFGNGMLLSEHICLVGAFNHMHIFIDPTPDAASSYQERQRLFTLPRSSWTDYNTDLISAGGGIFPRSAKSITLSPQACKALGTDRERLTPTELINIMLKAPVDLLWNGGIGTYIKASQESHADAADRSNDVLRVDANQVRAKVVGEGGNLGVTQKARIELSACGVRCYTDAIDNAAGVDCSDHEVNIKILLDRIVQAGDMTGKQRNQLLADMTDEVGTLVLMDNYQQTQCIERLNSMAASQLDEHARFMVMLEEADLLNRDLEFLPDKEQIAERLASQRGLLRPELSVVVSYAKMTLYTDALASSLPEDPWLTHELEHYFPQRLSEQFAEDIAQHRLSREIICTVVCNELVNRLGPSFAWRMCTELGASPADVLKAFCAVKGIYAMDQLWSAIEQLDYQVSAATQNEMMTLVNGLVERAIHWLLRRRRTERSIGELIGAYQAPIQQLLARLDDALDEGAQRSLDRRIDSLTAADVPTELARRAAAVIPLSASLDLAEVAEQVERPIEEAAALYYRLGSTLDLNWLRDEIAGLKASSHWHTLARSRLRSDLHNKLRDLSLEALAVDGEGVEAKIAQWSTTRQERLRHFQRTIGELKAATDTDFAMLSLALNEVQELLSTSV